MNASKGCFTPEPSQCLGILQGEMQSVVSVAADHWTAELRASSAPALEVRHVNGFLVLSGEPFPSTPPAGWDLLIAHANFAGLLKFCATPDGALSLRAEIPLEAGSNLACRLGQACRAFAAALNWPPDATSGPNPAAPEMALPDLAKLVEEAGWQSSSRRGDHCAVPLASRQGTHTALVTMREEMIRVYTELGSWESLTATSREALSALLLTANGELKLARASIVEDESGGVAQLEVLLQAPVGAAELRCALEALSVGADLCAAVTDILQHEAAAKLFLAIRGGPRVREDSQQTTERRL